MDFYAFANPNRMVKFCVKSSKILQADVFFLKWCGFFLCLSQVTVFEADQIWIYGNYTCKANNELGANDIKIELRRASK